MRSLRPAACAALFTILVGACASTSDFDIRGGMIGPGGSFEYRGPDGFVWGYAADGDDLRLERDGATLLLVAVVPPQGLRYLSGPDLDRPDLTFGLAGGHQLRWNDGSITVRGDNVPATTWRFGISGTSETIELDALLDAEPDR